MPSVQDVVDAAELLQVRSLEVAEAACVAVRNRNSTCRKCAEACLANAITIGQNELDIDFSLCVNCGACVAACPMGAIRPVDPTQAEVLERAVAAARERESSMACIACARKASRHEADPSMHATVPCLGHVGEAALTHLTAMGLDDIVLVDGNCATCKYGAVSPRIDDAVENAITLMEAVEASAIITRTSEFPEELRAPQKVNTRGADRRGIMAQTGSYLKTVATNVANKTIEEHLGTGKKEQSLRERLGVTGVGKLPTIYPERNMRILDDLSRMGEPAPDVLSVKTRDFGEVTIDAEKCSGCSLCVMHCPTGTLKHAEFDEPEGEKMRYLEFRASECTQCMLCKDVCMRDCLEVASAVRVQDLFDFEPRLIEIPRPQNKVDLSAFAKKRKEGREP